VLSNDRFDVSLASLIAARRPMARSRAGVRSLAGAAPTRTRVRRKRRDAAPGVRYSGILPTQMSLNITQSPIRL
jgi:hypothetical protein